MNLPAVESLTVMPAGRPVLRDVSFGPRPRELVAPYGANGAGKTTLLRTRCAACCRARARPILVASPACRRARGRDGG